MFKVGQWVRVRADLVEDRYYSGEYFVYPMSKYKGRIYKIKSVRNIYFGTQIILLEGCVKPLVSRFDTQKYWYFTSPMLEYIDYSALCEFLKKGM